MAKIDNIIEQHTKGMEHLVVGEYIYCGWDGSSDRNIRSGEKEHRVDSFQLWLYGKSLCMVKEDLKLNGYKWNGMRWVSKPILSYEELMKQIETYKEYLSDISVGVNTSNERFVE